MRPIIVDTSYESSYSQLSCKGRVLGKFGKWIYIFYCNTTSPQVGLSLLFDETSSFSFSKAPSTRKRRVGGVVSTENGDFRKRLWKWRRLKTEIFENSWFSCGQTKTETFENGVGPSSLTWRPLSRSVILIGQTWFNQHSHRFQRGRVDRRIRNKNVHVDATILMRFQFNKNA